MSAPSIQSTGYTAEFATNQTTERKYVMRQGLTCGQKVERD